MKSLKTYLAAAASAGALAIAAPASATTLTTDFGAWSAAVGSYQETSNFGAEFRTVNSVSLNGGVTLTSNNPQTVLQVPGSWATWSGGYTGQVLTSAQNSDTFTVSPATKALGFYAEPSNFAVYDVTLTLGSGASITEAVNGDGGAAFFGWYGGGVSSYTISADPAAGGFATGEFFVGATVPGPVPGAGVAGLAALALAGLYTRARRA